MIFPISVFKRSMMARGVRAGATIPRQSRSGISKPASANVGTFGSNRMRSGAVVAKALTWLPRINGRAQRRGSPRGAEGRAGKGTRGARAAAGEGRPGPEARGRLCLINNKVTMETPKARQKEGSLERKRDRLANGPERR